MKLEEQLATLKNCGLTLNDSITIDDLLYSFSREDYENEPFDVLLFVYGIEQEREPWGYFSPNVWNFDTECIVTTGDYVTVVNRLCEISGQPNLITHLEDFVSLESREAWLKYQIDGKQREWTVDVDDDWVDMMVLTYVMDDIERDGKHFYTKDNGQAMILMYLDKQTAAKLNELTGDAIKRVLVE